jgi:hypothetical protein
VGDDGADDIHDQVTAVRWIGMRPVLLAIATTALWGCGTARLSNEVKPYVGRDFHELTARLGNPTGKREATGNRVYVWSVDSEGVLPTGSGGEGIRTVEHECTLEVTVNQENIIQGYEIGGSDAGCAAFRHHLNR